MMRKQGIRLSMGRKNDGFTLIELIVSLFLLTSEITSLSLIGTTDKRFLVNNSLFLSTRLPYLTIVSLL